jgi:hypothetical protein
VHRGVRFVQHYGKYAEGAEQLIAALTNEGSTLELNRTMSWSKTRGVAAMFAKTESNKLSDVQIIMSLTPKTKAVDISSVADARYTHQQEVVVDGYNRAQPLKYRVKRVSTVEQDVHDSATSQPSGYIRRFTHVELEEL